MWEDCDNIFWTGFLTGVSLTFCSQILINRLYARNKGPLLMTGEEGGWAEINSNSPKSGDTELSL